MLIMPAIDLIGGRCVRLLKGDFDAVTEYGDPLAQAAAFADAGAEWIHVVDLDGAKQKAPAQLELIAAIAAASRAKLQVGGGVRRVEDVAALLHTGAERVVVGSAAVREPVSVNAWIHIIGLDRICCAFDVRQGGGGYEIAVDGWTRGAGLSLEAALAFYPPDTLRHVLITDIARDGALVGPNAALIADVAAARPDLEIQASGGVATLEDIAILRAAGASAAIIGRALYERRFSLEQAFAG